MQATDQKNLNFQVIAAKELPGNTGGKPRLVSFYKELKKKRMLRNTAFGKSLTNAFFLDKDIDDLSRAALRSVHVIYTRTYDLEGDLYVCGDISRAAADACGLTLAQVRGILGDPHTWITRHSQNWIDWTTLCVISQLKQVNPGATFNRLSEVNVDLLGQVDADAVQNFKTKLTQLLNTSPRAFDSLYLRYRRVIERNIANGEPLRFFKGKWLLSIIGKEITQKNIAPDAQLQAIGQKITVSLVGQVGNRMDCQCCARPMQSIQRLIEGLN